MNPSSYGVVSSAVDNVPDDSSIPNNAINRISALIGPQASRPIRLFIIDDHLIIRAGLRELLKGHSVINIVGEAEDIAGAMRAVETLRPDVVLLDIMLGRESGLDACAELVRCSPQTKVILFTGDDDDMCLSDALPVGAHGYLLKWVCLDSLVKAFNDVVADKIVCSPAIDDHLTVFDAAQIGPRDWPGAPNGLSRRESEVLQLMAQGLDNRHIARTLFIGEETVKTHVKAVLRKLKARDRTHGVVIALRGRVVS